MDYIRPIGPVDREIEPVYRVDRAPGEHEGRDPEERKRRPRPQSPAPAAPEEPADGPVQGDDGHLHIDVRA